MNRRDYLALMGLGAGALAAGSLKIDGVFAQQATAPQDTGAPTTSTIEDRTRRMQWWHAARFGMFIHWCLYSVLGRHEWVMENEGIPVAEYEQLAQLFQPKPNAAQRLGQAGSRCGPEVHGDDNQASRRLLQLRHQADRLLRSQAGARARPGPRIRRCCQGRRFARRLLLLADGLAPSRRRAVCHRRIRAQALRCLYPRPHPRTDDQLREDRHPLV